MRLPLRLPALGTVLLRVQQMRVDDDIELGEASDEEGEEGEHLLAAEVPREAGENLFTLGGRDD